MENTVRNQILDLIAQARSFPHLVKLVTGSFKGSEVTISSATSYPLAFSDSPDALFTIWFRVRNEENPGFRTEAFFMSEERLLSWRQE